MATKFVESDLIIQKIKDYIQREDTFVKFDASPSSDLGKSGMPFSYEESDKLLTVQINNLSETDKVEIMNLIVEIHNQGHLLWKASKKDEVFSYQNYSKVNPNKTTLLYFENIISADDFMALKMSMYLREKSKNGKNINKDKKDIRDRFGDRGANIANLCTANYFEDEFMPLHKEKSNDIFYEYYELAVGKKARALFVHSGMSLEAMEKEVDLMVNKALMYHLGGFTIHGKGEVNVKTIKDFNSNRSPEEDSYVMVKSHEDPELKVIEYDVKLL